MPDFPTRIEIGRTRMQDLGIDLMYLTPGANTYYLSGWHRIPPTFGATHRPANFLMGMLVGLAHGPIFVVPRMFADFWLVKTPGMDVKVVPDLADPQQFLTDLLASFPGKHSSVAIENRASAELVIALQQALPDVSLRLASDVLAEMRMIKTDEELETMRQAGKIVDRTMQDILHYLKPGSGMTEIDVVYEVDRLMMQHGAAGPSFTTNVWQMGPAEARSLAIKSSRRPLEHGNSLCFDFGSVYDEYCYDFGRAVFLGEPSAEYRHAYDLVMSAAQAGVDALRADQYAAEEVDAIARNVIGSAGYGQYFGHRLGHGIGLDVHEPPFLNKGDRTMLREGMCFTVEPSVFIPGKFGARTEDVFVVREGTPEVLSHFRRDLQIIE
ncbi:MAG: aminopeptidase P family protein [Chloroflexi bacterium]|nr:aminopeptidase P family protein [Chloroflexota bacterium]